MNKRPDGSTWEEFINETEQYAFFEGAISFLFSDEKGKMVDWDNFDVKWVNAKKYFDENGVRVTKDFVTNSFGAGMSIFNTKEKTSSGIEITMFI